MFVAGCGWRLWSLFVFWHSGASARWGVSLIFVLEVLPPPFPFSSCRRLRLVLVLRCWSLLLVFLFWCPVASARPGCLSCGGCVWCLLFGALGFLGLLPALGRSSLWFVCGVCLLALWGFCSPGGVFWFLFWWFCPFVLFLFLLAAAVDFCPLMLVAAVGVPLLVPCGFCRPWGVFLVVVVSGVFCLVGFLGLLPALGCFRALL